MLCSRWCIIWNVLKQWNCGGFIPISGVHNVFEMVVLPLWLFQHSNGTDAMRYLMQTLLYIKNPLYRWESLKNVWQNANDTSKQVFRMFILSLICLIFDKCYCKLMTLLIIWYPFNMNWRVAEAGLSTICIAAGLNIHIEFQMKIINSILNGCRF